MQLLLITIIFPELNIASVGLGEKRTLIEVWKCNIGKACEACSESGTKVLVDSEVPEQGIHVHRATRTHHGCSGLQSSPEGEIMQMTLSQGVKMYYIVQPFHGLLLSVR